MLPLDLHFGSWSDLDYAKIETIINWIWNIQTGKYRQQLIKYVQNSRKPLKKLIPNPTEKSYPLLSSSLCSNDG